MSFPTSHRAPPIKVILTRPMPRVSNFTAHTSALVLDCGTSVRDSLDRAQSILQHGRTTCSYLRGGVFGRRDLRRRFKPRRCGRIQGRLKSVAVRRTDIFG